MAQRTKRNQGRGKKHRKHGRWSNKPSNQRYYAEGRMHKNKARRINRMLRKNPALWENLEKHFPNLPDEVKRLLR